MCNRHQFLASTSGNNQTSTLENQHILYDKWGSWQKFSLKTTFVRHATLNEDQMAIKKPQIPEQLDSWNEVILLNLSRGTLKLQSGTDWTRLGLAQIIISLTESQDSLVLICRWITALFTIGLHVLGIACCNFAAAVVKSQIVFLYPF